MRSSTADGFVPNETDQRDRFVNHYNFVDNPCWTGPVLSAGYTSTNPADLP